MPLASYADLQASVGNWLMREDLAGAIPDFVALAEQVINYGSDDQPGLRTAEMEMSATLPVAADGTATLPDDYLQWRGITPSMPGYNALSFVAPDALAAWETSGGVPRHFSISGYTLKTYPPANGDVMFAYYAKIPALSDVNPTNWLLTKAPGVYLYGALLHAAPYLGDDARISTWSALYKQLISGLQGSDTAARFANTVIRRAGPTP